MLCTRGLDESRWDLVTQTSSTFSVLCILDNNNISCSVLINHDDFDSDVCTIYKSMHSVYVYKFDAQGQSVTQLYWHTLPGIDTTQFFLWSFTSYILHSLGAQFALFTAWNWYSILSGACYTVLYFVSWNCSIRSLTWCTLCTGSPKWVCTGFPHMKFWEHPWHFA